MNGETVLHRPPSHIPWLQLFILTGGTFMAFLDTSIVNVALPKLMSIFGVGLDSIQWVTTAYLLSAGVTIPVTGFFGDRWGIKNLFLLSLGVFTLGSAMCAVAASENFLIAARVIQAVGGGAIMPVTTSYTYQIVTRDKIGVALGTRGIAMAAAPAFGPVLGGWLIDRFDWHIIFTINLPVGILVILLGMMALPRIPTHAKPRLDVPGLAMVTAGAFSLLLGLSKGQSEGWHSLGIVLALTVGAFAMIVFIIWELTCENPIIDLRVFKGNPTLAASFTGTFLVTVALYAGMLLIPVFTQQIMGFTPLQTGILMAPGAIAMGIVSPFAGRLFDRFGAIPLCLVGIAIVATTSLQMSHLGVSTPFRTLEIWNAERGAGMALFMMPMTAVGLNTVPRQLMNRVTSLNSLVRQLSGSFGIAFITYVYDAKELAYSAMYGEKITAASPAAAGFLNGVTGRLHSPAASPAALYYLQHLVLQHATARAIDYTMVLAAIIVLLVLTVVFFLRGPKKPPVPGSPEQPLAQGARPGPPVPATR